MINSDRHAGRFKHKQRYNKLKFRQIWRQIQQETKDNSNADTEIHKGIKTIEYRYKGKNRHKKKINSVTDMQTN